MTTVTGGVQPTPSTFSTTTGATQTSATTQTADAGAPAQPIPDSKLLYLGFAPLALSNGSLGLSLPFNAGDTTALIGEITLALEKSASASRNAEAQTRAGFQRGAIFNVLASLANLSALQQKINDDTATLKQKEATLKTDEADLKTAKDTRSAKIDEKNGLSADIAYYSEVITELDDLIANETDPDTVSFLESYRSAYIDARDMAQAQVDTLTSEISDLDTKISDLEAEIASLKNEIAQLKDDINQNSQLFSFGIFMLLTFFLMFFAFDASQFQAVIGDRADRDLIVESRFDGMLEKNIEIDARLKEIALSLDLQMDKTNELGDLRRILLPAFAIASGFVSVMAELRAALLLDDNIDDAAMLQAGRYRLGV